MIVTAPDPLSVDEKIELSQLEERIDRGFRAFMEAGEALAVIQERRLYRETHGTFADYLQSRWNMSETRGYELIGASQVVKTLSAIAEKPKRLPANECQSRPLTKVPPETVGEVWDEVVETAPGGKITGSHVEKVVAKKLGKQPDFQPGTQATIVADDHKDYQATVEVVSVDRDLVQARKPDGATLTLFKSEIAPLTKEAVQIQTLKNLLKQLLGYSSNVPDDLVSEINAALSLDH